MAGAGPVGPRSVFGPVGPSDFNDLAFQQQVEVETGEAKMVIAMRGIKFVRQHQVEQKRRSRNRLSRDRKSNLLMHNVVSLLMLRICNSGHSGAT